MDTTHRINIMLADGQNLSRKAMKNLIEDHPRCKVIAEANNGRELLELLKITPPDIVLMDLEMTVMNGHETMGFIQRRFPAVKVIVLSIYNEIAYVADMISLGARAYIPKSSEVTMLWRAIFEVHREGYYFDPYSANAVLKGFQLEKSINPLMDEQALSKREVEILRELCRGRTNKEIAGQLNITVTTVSFHRSNIYKKTKSHNVTELVKYGIRHGVVVMN